MGDTMFRGRFRKKITSTGMSNEKRDEVSCSFRLAGRFFALKSMHVFFEKGELIGNGLVKIRRNINREMAQWVGN